MLERGVIRPSNFPYCSPIVIVTKKDGSPQFCVDYRQLNKITHAESSQLPPIQETIGELGTASIFSMLDLKSGYWKVPVAEESKQYAAFSTPDGSTLWLLALGMRRACLKN